MTFKNETLDKFFFTLDNFLDKFKKNHYHENAKSE